MGEVQGERDMLRYWSTDWRVPVRIREFFSSTATSVYFYFYFYSCLIGGRGGGRFCQRKLRVLLFYIIIF